MPARCANCQSHLPPSLAADGGPVICGQCNRPNWVSSFPALHSNVLSAPPVLPAEPPAPGEAACFYSPLRRATQSCSHCGVLISDIWAAHWGQEVVCLKCLDHLRDKGRDQRFEKKRMLWDNIALALSLVPFTLFFWWAVFLTAPAALFIALRFWKGPFSMVPRTRFRMALALLISFLQLAVIITGFLALLFDIAWLKNL